MNGTWEEALAYCEGLTLGDHSDWRLPTIKELNSIVDYGRFAYCDQSHLFPKYPWELLLGIYHQRQQSRQRLATQLLPWPRR